MVTDFFLLDCSLCLTPRLHNRVPNIILKFNDTVFYSGLLHKTTIFRLDKMVASGQHSVSITFDNKTDADTIVEKNLDMAVIIDSIEFNKISNPRFVWEGEYRPIYNPEWVKQQTVEPAAVLKNSTYLGWNGTWKLNFTVPIFTWIHKTLDYGWIYD